MAKLKKYQIHKVICDMCKGNGYVTINGPNLKKIHQCWECDSEGEFYVYKDNTNHGSRNTYKFLH
jgi:DnaJ-class molecular chaperone